MVKLRVSQKPGTKPVLVLGYYVKPDLQRSSLLFADAEIRQQIETSKFSAIVLAGDLNTKADDLLAFMPISRILHTNTVPEGTRRQNDSHWSAIDYVCSTSVMSQATRFDHLSRSDHWPIGA